MRFTDLFIRRPVLAIVVAVAILLFGLRAGFMLPVRGFPKTVSAQINVSTTYYGADADVMAGFITTPLENAIAQASGIDYMTSSSSPGQSQITAFLRLNYDPYKAMTEIQSLVNSVSNQLPSAAQSPAITMQTTDQNYALALGFSSKVMSPEQITDYLNRVVQPQIQAVPGVQQAQIQGAQNYALRVWIEPEKLAAFGLTATDVTNALTANDYITGAGNTAGEMTAQILGVSSGLHSAAEFRNLVVKQTGGGLIRLGDVAKVELGSDNYQLTLLENGRPAIFLAVQVAPDANALEVAANCRAKFAAIKQALPPGLDADIGYDFTLSVAQSVREVAKTLAESLLIVTLVVFAFLRTVRASVIPVITIPLSLIGAFGVMWALGFSINLLTLLSLVLATGLVVDDAIIVVESITREIAEGATPLVAALRSARALASPIVAMTIVLVAVYVPIALRSGLTGALFTEFAMTLVGAVTVSAILALTLSPVMCRFLLKPAPRAAVRTRGLSALGRYYRPVLRLALRWRYAVLAFGVVVLGASAFFYHGAKSELAPQEDDSVVNEQATVPATGTIDLMRLYDAPMEAIYRSIPEAQVNWQVDAPGEGGTQGGMTLVPAEDRTRSSQAIADDLQQKAASIAGENVAFYLDPSLPGVNGLPVMYVLKTTQSAAALDTISQEFEQRMNATGLFAFADRDLKIDLPETDVVVDRDKVAALGLDMSKVGGILNGMLSGGYVNYFSRDGRSYKVIPEVVRGARLDPAALGNYTISNINGVPVPLSAVAHLVSRVGPEQISHFQQMNSATISGVPMPGVTQAQALAALDKIAKEILPNGYATDTAGPLRQFAQESSGFVATFGFALVVVYLALAALFGSFRDPLIVLMSVPMSIGGALLFIWLGINGASINIYTEVGLVTLMGLISKHGILMVEVANEQQALGQGKWQAIEHAAMLRLRPILMTTAAMVLGVAPLVFARGAGAASRFAIGLTIASGLAIGTLFTLLVVPAFYLMLARDHASDRERAETEAAVEAAAE